MMKKLRYPVAFTLTVALLTVLLVLSAKIPQSSIQENMLRSAEFLAERPLFGTAVEGIEGSCIDRYADSILLGIAWQYNGETTLRSVMESSYYHTDYQNENQNLLDAVSQNLSANQQYLRYWHGSIGFLRPLLCVFTLPQIYALNGLVLAVLTIWLLVSLLLVLWFGKEKTALRPVAVKNVLAWGCGYVGMWITKWLLAAIALGENVLPMVAGACTGTLGWRSGTKSGPLYGRCCAAKSWMPVSTGIWHAGCVGSTGLGGIRHLCALSGAA